MEEKLTIVCKTKIKKCYKEEELLECLNECFQILDNMASQHRDNFSKLDVILSTHNDIITDIYKTYEINIFHLFSVKVMSYKDEIQAKRNKESEYLSKKKEEELAGQEAQTQEDKKKVDPKAKKKDAIQVALVPPREIIEYISKTDNTYLIDESIDYLANFYLQEMHFEIEDLERNDENTYMEINNKVFISPMLDGTKLFSEENTFTKEFLMTTLSTWLDIYDKNIKNTVTNAVAIATTVDTEKREDYLQDVNFKLISIPPRKGKIETDDYYKRSVDIERHVNKYKQFTQSIVERNNSDNKNNENILIRIQSEYDELEKNTNKIIDSFKDEDSLKSLENKNKKIKIILGEFKVNKQVLLNENLVFTKENPAKLKKETEIYIESLQGYDKGGSFSEEEIKYYKVQLEELNKNVLGESIANREVKCKELNDKVIILIINFTDQ